MTRRWVALCAVLAVIGVAVLSDRTGRPSTAVKSTRALPTVSTTTSTSTTTTVLPPPPTSPPHTHAVRPRVAPRAARASSSPRVVSGDIWRRLANCESSTGRDSSSGKYHGFFQFSLATWRSVGGSGDPHMQSYETQLHFAQILQARSGFGQWPTCARKLGLI